MIKSLRDRIAALNNAGVPFMEGREKGDIKNAVGSELHVDAYGYILNEKKEEYVVLSFVEMPDLFFFGGGIVTAKFKELETIASKMEIEEILQEGLPVLLTDKKSKNKRDYMAIEFYPETV